MATNHPVFSFEQRLKCGEIYSKITSSKAHLNQQQSSTSTSPVTSPLSSFNVQHQTASPPPFQSGTFQQQPNPQQMMNPTAQQQIPNPILMPMAFPQAAVCISFFFVSNSLFIICIYIAAAHMLSLNLQNHLLFMPTLIYYTATHRISNYAYVMNAVPPLTLTSDT